MMVVIDGNEENSFETGFKKYLIKEHRLWSFSADGFGSNQYEKYDAIIATYHDQGLIPLKHCLW
jgi:4-hydroxythreonine-4-phosphate dehydrogenase